MILLCSSSTQSYTLYYVLYYDIFILLLYSSTAAQPTKTEKDPVDA